MKDLKWRPPFPPSKDLLVFRPWLKRHEPICPKVRKINSDFFIKSASINEKMDKIWVIFLCVQRCSYRRRLIYSRSVYKMASILNQQTHVWFQKLNGFQDKRCFLKSSLHCSHLSVNMILSWNYGKRCKLCLYDKLVKNQRSSDWISVYKY